MSTWMDWGALMMWPHARPGQQSTSIPSPRHALGEGEQVGEARLVRDALVVQHHLQDAQRVHVEEHRLQRLLLPPSLR